MTSILNFSCFCSAGFIVFDFMKTAFGKKYSSQWCYIIAYILFISGYVLVTFLSNTLVKALFGIVAAIILGYLIYQQHARKAIYIGIFMLYLSICDTLGMVVGITIEKVQVVNYTEEFRGAFISSVIAQVFMLCTYQLITKLLMKRSFDSVTWREMVFQFAFVGFQIVAIFLSAYSLEEESAHFFLLFLSVGFIGTDVYIIYLFQNLSEHNLLKQRQSLETQQQYLLNQYYNEMDQKYETSRIKLHDMKYHLQMVQELIVAAELNAGNSYMEALKKQSESLTYKFVSKNRILNAVINDIMQRAEIKNIKFTFKIQEVPLDFVKNIDMTTIFSNILNNALEACEDAIPENRWIKLNVLQCNQNVVIYAVNPCKEKFFSIEKWKTSKQGHSGIGLTNIKSTVENYQGIFEAGCSDYLFEVKISIPIP